MTAARGDDAHLEAVGIQLWRRLVLGGEGPFLTLAEAAAALGVSVETVRRRIRSGEVRARRDSAGRYRVVPAVTHAPDSSRETLYAWAEEAARLQKELQEARMRLSEIRREKRAIEDELAEARASEAGAQGELAALWRRLNSGQLGLNGSPPVPDEGKAPAANRVQSVVYDARQLFKRRQRHWPLVG